ncbi:response regulator [Flavobacterium aestuarii]|uniref:response regulator n=1 Tax=Flavobacterium aestuarii TaxID=3149227 RepID=UPI0032B54309
MIKDDNLYTILIIEDNLGDYFLAKEYLEEMFQNLEIYHCPNFTQAENFKKSSNIIFDVILLDLSLPDKDKDSLMKEILLLFSTTPIIVLTGYSDFSFATKSIALGASDYLLKDGLNGMILYKSIVYSIERNKHVLKHAASEKEYADLFHLSPQPMWVYDKANDHFEVINNAAINHYGYTNEEFIKLNYSDIEVLDSNEEMQETTSIYPAKIIQHKKKDGQKIYVEIVSNTIIYKGKEREVVLVNDITENLKHLEAIRIRNNELTEIQWIQSHIVRAPVARILGLINLITDDIETDLAEVKKILKYINTSANELDDIIREISAKTDKFKK